MAASATMIRDVRVSAAVDCMHYRRVLYNCSRNTQIKQYILYTFRANVINKHYRNRAMGIHKCVYRVIDQTRSPSFSSTKMLQQLFSFIFSILKYC